MKPTRIIVLALTLFSLCGCIIDGGYWHRHHDHHYNDH